MTCANPAGVTNESTMPSTIVVAKPAASAPRGLSFKSPAALFSMIALN
jgi:hypothetical protein